MRSAGAHGQRIARRPERDDLAPGVHPQSPAQDPQALPMGMTMRLLAVTARLEDEQEFGRQLVDGMPSAFQRAPLSGGWLAFLLYAQVAS